MVVRMTDRPSASDVTSPLAARLLDKPTTFFKPALFFKVPACWFQDSDFPERPIFGGLDPGNSVDSLTCRHSGPYDGNLQWQAMGGGFGRTPLDRERCGEMDWAPVHPLQPI